MAEPHPSLSAPSSRRELTALIERLAVSADAKALLAQLLATTVEIGGRVVEAGRHAFETLRRFPNTAFGVIVGVAMSMLIGSVPVLGLILGPLLDLMGALAMRVASIDGRCDPAESEVITTHFIEDWGYDPAYASRALALIAAESDTPRVKQLAQALAAFQASNPDCNAAAMQTELLAFLRNIAAADGLLDEREELAIEAIEAVFRAETDLSLRRVGRAVVDWSSAARSAVDGLAGRLGRRPATG